MLHCVHATINIGYVLHSYVFMHCRLFCVHSCTGGYWLCVHAAQLCVHALQAIGYVFMTGTTKGTRLFLT